MPPDICGKPHMDTATYAYAYTGKVTLIWDPYSLAYLPLPPLLKQIPETEENRN